MVVWFLFGFFYYSFWGGGGAVLVLSTVLVDNGICNLHVFFGFFWVFFLIQNHICLFNKIQSRHCIIPIYSFFSFYLFYLGGHAIKI